MPSYPSQQQMLSHNGETIFYTLERKPVKNLNLRVKADGSVAVSAHPRVPLGQVETFLILKWDFIQKARRTFAQDQSSAPRQDGDPFPLLDETLTLRLEQGEENTARREGDLLVVTVEDPQNSALVDAAIDGFLLETAKALFPAVVAEQLTLAAPYGVTMPVVRARKMKSRWGSCLPGKKMVTLNTLLLTKPRDCLEYVALHELCHFVQPNHSTTFQLLMTNLMPDWKLRRSLLLGKKTE